MLSPKPTPGKEIMFHWFHVPDNISFASFCIHYNYEFSDVHSYPVYPYNRPSRDRCYKGAREEHPYVPVLLQHGANFVLSVQSVLSCPNLLWCRLSLSRDRPLRERRGELVYLIRQKCRQNFFGKQNFDVFWNCSSGLCLMVNKPDF